MKRLQLSQNKAKKMLIRSDKILLERIDRIIEGRKETDAETNKGASRKKD